MATTENRGAVDAEILPPCQRDTGQLCLAEFSGSGKGRQGRKSGKSRLEGRIRGKRLAHLTQELRSKAGAMDG